MGCGPVAMIVVTGGGGGFGTCAMDAAIGGVGFCKGFGAGALASSAAFGGGVGIAWPEKSIPIADAVEWISASAAASTASAQLVGFAAVDALASSGRFGGAYFTLASTVGIRSSTDFSMRDMVVLP